MNKKFYVSFFAIIVALFVVVSCDFKESAASSTERHTVATQDATRVAANTSVPIPNPAYFHERATMARWIEYWDKPTRIPTYVYIYSYGTCIGYFVADGKPASTQSFLLPEEEVRYERGHMYTGQAPDLDGTYGANNPGWRVFSATGAPIAIEGQGVFLIYSDVPFNLDVPELYAGKK